MRLLIFLSLVSFFIGVYMILCDIFKIPALQTTRMMVSFYQDEKVYKLDILLNELANKLSKYIVLNEYKRKKLLASLKMADINSSPEKYIASVWIKTLLSIIIAIPASIIIPIILPIALVFSTRTYFKESRIVDSKMIEKRKAIEYELPRFTRDITEELKSTRDVLNILERYKKTAGDELKRELDITIADMRSGNYETALTRFETRIQSPMLSDVIRGLISVIRGDDALIYFQLLSHDFKALELQRLKQEVAKRPGKIRKFSFLILACMLLMYIVIIVIAIVRGMGGLF